MTTLSPPSPPAETSRCPKCGTILHEGNEYCPKCGHKPKSRAQWEKVVSDAQLQEEKLNRAKDMPRYVARALGIAGTVLFVVGFPFVFLPFLFPELFGGFPHYMNSFSFGFGAFLAVLGFMSWAVSDYLKRRLRTKGEAPPLSITTCVVSFWLAESITIPLQARKSAPRHRP